MVDANIIRSMISGFMDEIPEVEGIAVFDTRGKLITGYSIRDYDFNLLAEKSLRIAKNAANISKYLGKGKIAELTVMTEDSVIVIMGRKGVVVTVFTGVDGKPQLGLIRHELTIFMDMITKST
ncbi:MAG: hypothetical protein ACTSYO_00935 [Candidatus Ranarchaeia archaeon]